MKGTLRVATASGLLLSFAAVGLHAQAHVVMGLGGGLSFPAKSGFNSVESPALSVKSMGWNAVLIFGIVPKPDSKVTIRADLGYGNVHYKDPTPARDKAPKMSIRNVNLDLVLHPVQKGTVKPYIMAGGTLVSWDYRTGETSSTAGGTGSVKGSVGFNGGAGINIGNNPNVWFFAEARYIWTKDRAFASSGSSHSGAYIPISVGIRVRPKGNK